MLQEEENEKRIEYSTNKYVNSGTENVSVAHWFEHKNHLNTSVRIESQ